MCCSNNKCVHSDICLNGRKLFNDSCNLNFECMTTCCYLDKCSSFKHCHRSCKTNADCNSTTGCCSESFCSDNSLCDSGIKLEGDYCDRDQECNPRLKCLENMCQVFDNDVHPQDVVLIIMIIVTGIIAMFIIVYSCFKICCSKPNGKQDRRR